MLEVAKAIDGPSDWALKRYKTMEKIQWDKFLRNKGLREKLISTTTERELVNVLTTDSEENLFWGVIQKDKASVGKNMLGQILTQIRYALIQGNEYQQWLTLFNLAQNKKMMPKIVIDVYKEE